MIDSECFGFLTLHLREEREREGEDGACVCALCLQEKDKTQLKNHLKV